MPFPLLGLLIGAAAGGIKSAAIDAPRANRQRKLQAETTMYSPWTGMKAAAPKEADPFGSMLQYGATGAGLEQAQNSAALDEEAMDLMRERMRGTAPSFNPWSNANSSELPDFLRKPYGGQ